MNTSSSLFKKIVSQLITCPPLNAPAAKKRCEVLWGSRQGWIPCNESMPVGTHVTLECPEFYERKTGATHTTCLHDGTWSQLPLHCQPICGIRTTPGIIYYTRGNKIVCDKAELSFISRCINCERLGNISR